ncbi:DUF3267 domain-containing protein [Runella sp.]|uniref:DUF3267 domain-containing protein n=1 Tax=Runella sp. TaxID=1960881 RepID=UPI003D0E6467
MKPTIEQLHNSPNYELVDSFHIDQMGEFLAREIRMKQKKAASDQRKMTPKTFLLFLIFGGIGWAIGSVLGKATVKSGVDGTNIALQFGLAFLGFFVVLLPIHEAIHALFFKALGAEKVGFGWSKKSLIVYAYAQKFVMTLRENAWAAAMPFIVITIALAFLWYLFPQWPLFWATALFFHTTACIGDFILIRYYFKNVRYRMYTYDDIEEKNHSYFFREKIN